MRSWLTTKSADPYFYGFMTMALVVFAVEIMINAMVQVDFKYSFFFWLDIIATVSLIPDIPWIADVVGYIVLSTPNYLSVNAIPGVVSFSETLILNRWLCNRRRLQRSKSWSPLSG